uniref:C2H2-type domain-containing protein n=1 Tax=Pectinophora gossypiella TaxID=13191 RepID=A0A1E1WKV5_PECGO
MTENVDELTAKMAELTVLSFRKVEDVKRLVVHFNNVINHPLTQEKPVLQSYLKNLNETHRKIYFQKREGVEVEYIFTTEKKSNLQRQRFNSLPVSEVPELLKAELLNVENAKQVHICTDCDVEIEMNDEEPLMESLQKHFNLEVHLPKPKMKRESVDVAEPIILPNMSRRLSAMECGETPAQMAQILQLVKPMEKLDRTFSAKLEASLIRHLPDNSEASIDAAVKFYQAAYDKLCQEVAVMDFSDKTSSVAPIIMSIKDNVNQNFATDANKNFENEDNDQAPEAKTQVKNQVKKYRYYGPIENYIVELLLNHKLLSLVDDRTGKLAFFCMACEYYTLRFRYDSVLSHVFSETHINNLSCILQADKHIPFSMRDTSMDKIKEMNYKFLHSHSVSEDANGYSCGLCKHNIDSIEASIMHILDENHLAKLSDKLYRKMKANNQDGVNPDEWGPKSLDWSKFLASVGKPLNNRDHVVIENFIKPSGKIANYCSCCDMTLKGPRQVLFNHIRQKKHLRNAAPHKLALLYKNHCRPSEYYASFGNYYVCAVCPMFIALPSFAAIVEHFESTIHIETIAKMIRTALYEQTADSDILASNKIIAKDGFKCDLCDVALQDLNEAMTHVLSNIQHQNLVVDAKTQENKGDIISVYMRGNYILHNEGASFTCTVCKGVFNSIRSLLTHLIYADHFAQKPSTENVFRFYLELKHNINMLGRNKYDYYEFGKLKCGVCDADLEEGENAKKHVVSPRHRENMGASYVNLNDVSTVE